MAEPHSCLPPAASAKSICDVAMQPEGARPRPASSVLPRSHLCSERGESPAGEPEETQEQKGVGIPDWAEILAKQLLELVGHFIER